MSLEKDGGPKINIDWLWLLSEYWPGLIGGIALAVALSFAREQKIANLQEVSAGNMTPPPSLSEFQFTESILDHSGYFACDSSGMLPARLLWELSISPGEFLTITENGVEERSLFAMFDDSTKAQLTCMSLK